MKNHNTTFSMTSFARQRCYANWGWASWEIRSLNHRHLEINCRLPDAFTSLEPLLRTKIAQHIKRGRIDVRLDIEMNLSEVHGLTLNEQLLTQLLTWHTHINHLSASCQPPDALKILAWPGILRSAVQNHEENPLMTELFALFDRTLIELITIRKAEGQALAHALIQRLDQLDQYVQAIKEKLPAIRAKQHQKITDRFYKLSISADSNRLEQELVLAIQKIDVSEELDRLTIHLAEYRNRLQNSSDRAGRRLDFLSQELIREITTLSAKSVDAEMSLQTIDMKVLVEEMREQVQNIE